MVDIYENKSVVLVGPSEYIIHTSHGDTIDSFDTVVRMNNQWPVSDSLHRSIGKRTDVLYHCCNSDYDISRILINELSDIKLLCLQSGAQYRLLSQYCDDLGIQHIDISNIYRSIYNIYNIRPNTGIVAISHILSHKIKNLHLVGITFNKQRYYDGYLGHGANSSYWENGHPDYIWKHDTQLQYDLFNSVLKNNKVTIDDEALKYM